MIKDTYFYDAILIPGGGVRLNYELPLWTVKRLKKALEIQHCRYFILLSAGTTHKPPPLDKDGFPIYESIAAANYLLQKGIEPEKILYETSSFDTIGNAYFSKVIHIEPLHLTKLLIITSDFHMERTKAIFRWLYSSKFSEERYELNFEPVSDSGIDQELINARKKKEKKSLENFLRTSKEIEDIVQLHKWLFTRHAAYSIPSNRELLNSDVLKTY